MSKYDVKFDHAKAVVIGDNATVNIVENTIASPPPIPRAELLAALHSSNAEMRAYPHEITGLYLQRSEVDDICRWILDANAEGSLGMVLDQPGAGKTVIMRSALVWLEEANVPVLAIKADTLSGIKNANELATRLNLPLNVSDLAAALASDEPFVVLMDQLDALSMNLSRDQPTLDVMLNTLAVLRDLKNVKVISSCRTFDLKHDPRLSAIEADKTFNLSLLTDEQVTAVLDRLNLDPARLLPSHRTLLRTPLHLSIYARLISDDPSSAPAESFGSLQELYEALWQRQIANRHPAAPPAAECIAAIYALVDAMQNNPQLTAPIGVLDEYSEAARYLQQVNFIRRERNNYLFAHQTLFDYCYARRFVATGRSISHEILAGPQGLFERSQMMQVLAYLRGIDQIAYRRELNALFSSSALRTHLKLLLMEWFGSLRTLLVDEIAIGQRLVSTPETRDQFLLSASDDGEWFDSLKTTELPNLLRQPEATISNGVFWYLGSVMPARSTDVISLLEPHIDESALWNGRIVFSLARLSDWSDDAIVDLLCRMFRTQHRETPDSDATLCLYNLAKSNPAGLCRALRAMLEQRVIDVTHEIAESRSASHDFSYATRSDLSEAVFGDHGIVELLEKAVKETPAVVIDQLLPWFIKSSLFASDPNASDSYPGDTMFSFGWYDGHITEGAAFSMKLRDALRWLAANEREQFRRIAQELTEAESLAAHRILISAYLDNAPLYVDDIVQYLTQDSRRLVIGERGARNYDSICLYGSVFALANEEQRGVLESTVLRHQPPWENRNHHFRGLSRLHFLKSVPRDLLTPDAERKLGELERRFPDDRFLPPQGIVARFVGSPIPESAMPKMSDRDWLSAMRKYNERFRRSGSLNPFAGGISELAAALHNEIKEDPERFYRLLLKFDATISFRYIQAVVSALADSTAPSSHIFDSIRRFSDRIPEDGRQAICQALDKRAKDDVPDDLLDMISTWALNDPDPREEEWRTTDRYGNSFYQGDPYNQGINSNRSVALQCFCRSAIQKKTPQIDRVVQLLKRAVSDPSTAVRSCVIECLDWMLYRHVDEQILDLFETVMEGHPRLLQLDRTAKFLSRTYKVHFDRVRQFIEAMLEDETDEPTRQNGAALACLAAFEYEDATPLAQAAINGDGAMRRGAAQVYARNLSEARVQDICREKLVGLMNDTDSDVRASVGNCFQHLRREHLGLLKDFIESYIASESLATSSRQLVTFLKPLAGDEPTLALTVTEQILDADSFRNPMANRRGATLAGEDDLTALVLTAYTHSPDDATKERAMTLFERLLLSGSYTARTALQDWDRR
jgi:hypothetical protein